MSTPAAINGKEIFELLREDLAAIEREFGRDTVSDVEAITEIGERRVGKECRMPCRSRWSPYH